MADAESMSPESVSSHYKYCPTCAKSVVTFQQRYSTSGDRQDNQFHYLETICAFCGKMLERELLIEQQGE